ncbi:MAG: hypothetical protein Kow00129_03740 [Thermoleophilia bacterium]
MLVYAETENRTAAEQEAVVVGQDPIPGSRAQTGDGVVLELQIPPPEVPIPALLGLTLDEAASLLNDRGLRIGAVREEPHPAAVAGTVVRQSPAQGVLIQAGSAVRLWIAKEAVPVPDLIGLTEIEADRRAQESGLRLQVLYETSDEVPPGISLRQTPPRETLVEPGTRVLVVINGSSDEPPDGATPAPSRLFASLAKTYSFPVLYPAELPPHLKLASGGTNPRHIAGTGGTGFEIRYEHSGASGAGLTLMEGNWFEAGAAAFTTVDVRGRPAELSRENGALVVSWQENGTRYAIRAEGFEDGEVIEFANSLRAVE